MTRGLFRLNNIKYPGAVRLSKPTQGKFDSFPIFMNFFSKPFTTLFSITIILGLIVAITSNNWLSLWLGLELNLYSFVPILLKSQINQEKEASIKYFLTQALASIIILSSSIPLQNINWTTLFILALLIKLGIAPCHFWLPTVINSISWEICWILSTLQKIAPILIITQSFNNTNPSIIIFISILRALTGRLGGLNQTQIRPILAYSSISHIAWITARSLVSPSTSIIYLAAYIVILTATIQPLISSSYLFTNHQTYLKHQPQTLKYITIINLIRLGGLPPTFGFLPKFLVLTTLASKNILILPIILIISSSINLYFYLKIILNLYFPTKQQPLYTQFRPKQNLLIPLFSTFRLTAATFIITTLI